MDDHTFRRRARTLAATLEPVIGQVFFAPECHAAYERLGFSPSPGSFGNGVAAPDGAAYFTSRGSLLGQVEPEVVASAFGVFKPAAVVAGVRRGLVGDTVSVQVRGGVLTIAWSGDGQPVRMTGPAATVFEGEWTY